MFLSKLISFFRSDISYSSRSLRNNYFDSW